MTDFPNGKGKAAADEMSRNLRAAGLPGHPPVTVVESASRPEERRITTRLDLLPLAAKSLGNGPALMLIGEALRQSPPSCKAQSIQSEQNHGEEGLELAKSFRLITMC